MLCHECALADQERPAAGLCRFCFVALCMAHLAEATQHVAQPPQYVCRHTPGGQRQEHEHAHGPVQHAAHVHFG